MSGIYKSKDHLFLKAKEQGYRSRAAYKLEELNKRLALFKRGLRVIDLGSAPGGWLQVAAQLVGETGLVLGIDLEQVKPFTPSEVRTNKAEGVVPVIITGDVTQENIVEELVELANGKVDLVISDMSPRLSGIKDRDRALSVELVESAFFVAQQTLRCGGTLVTKVFPGPETDELQRRLSPLFDGVRRVHLQSSRKTSKEFYFVARKYKYQ